MAHDALRYGDVQILPFLSFSTQSPPNKKKKKGLAGHVLRPGVRPARYAVVTSASGYSKSSPRVPPVIPGPRRGKRGRSWAPSGVDGERGGEVPAGTPPNASAARWAQILLAAPPAYAGPKDPTPGSASGALPLIQSREALDTLGIPLLRPGLLHQPLGDQYF